MFLSRLMVVVVLSTFCAVSTFAQGFYAGAQMAAGFQPWGSGVWGGSQGCVADNGSGGRRVPKEIRDIDDDLKKKARDLNRMKKEKAELEKEIADKKKAMKDEVTAINTIFTAEVVTGIKQHIGFDAASPLSGANTKISEVCGENGLKEGVAVGIPGDWTNKYCTGSAVGSGAIGSPSTPDKNWQGEWATRVSGAASKPGTIDNEVCVDSKYVKPEYAINGKGKTNLQNKMIADCKTGVVELAEKLSELEILEEQLNLMKENIRDGEKELKQAKDDGKKRKREIRDAIKDGDYEEDEDDDDDRTQADYCPTGNCRGGYRASTTDRIFSLVGSLGLAAGSYFGARSISRTNAELGWPTSPYLATSIAMPAALAGIYGATYGGGIGGNGCGGFGGPGGMGGWPGGGQFGGGAFGYPQGWGPNGGGGIMNGGCGPWGCTGYPGGYPGGGYGVPYANMGGGFQGGFPGGYPGGYQGGFQGFPGSYQGGFNGYPVPAGGGFPGGYAGGYAGPIAGGPITGVYSTNTGIPMVPYGGNYAGQYTGGGVGFPGGFGGAYVPTYNAYPYPAGGGFTGSFPGGGYQGGFQGFPGGIQGGFQGGYMGTYSGYNQILAQQAAIAQAQVQDYSARLQLTSRLGSQITQIQFQIQSILSGVGSASGYGYGGYGGIGYPTGTILPYPGSTTYDPNLNTSTTGTSTTTGVTNARGRFGL